MSDAFSARPTPLDRMHARLRDSRNPFERNALYVGRDLNRDFPVLLDVNLLLEHMHILGATGSGKTALAIIPLVTQLIRRNDGAVVVIDGKGDMALFNSVRIEAERTGRRFRWFTNQTYRSTYVFNPLEGDILRTLMPFDIVGYIMQALNLHHGDEYGRAWFAAVNRAIARRSLAGTSGSIGRRDLLRAVSYPRPPVGSLLELSDVLDELSTLDPDEFKAARHFCLLVDELAEIPQMNMSLYAQHPASVRDQAIQMSKVIRENEVVYFYLTAGINPISTAEVGRFAVYSLLLAALEHQRLTGTAGRAYCICDEAQTIIAQNIAQVLAQARSAGVGFVLSHQSMGQLRPPGGTDLRELVMMCTTVKKYLTSRDPWLDEYLSRASGQTKYFNASYRQSLDDFASGRVGAGYSAPGIAGGDEIGVSEFLGPRLMQHDIQDYSRQPNTCLFNVERQSGLSQFHGFMPVHLDWPLHRQEYERRLNSIPWPVGNSETIEVKPPWPEIVANRAVQESTPSPESALDDLKRIRDERSRRTK